MKYLEFLIFIFNESCNAELLRVFVVKSISMIENTNILKVRGQDDWRGAQWFIL